MKSSRFVPLFKLKNEARTRSPQGWCDTKVSSGTLAPSLDLQYCLTELVVIKVDEDASGSLGSEIDTYRNLTQDRAGCQEHRIPMNILLSIQPVHRTRSRT